MSLIPDTVMWFTSVYILHMKLKDSRGSSLELRSSCFVRRFQQATHRKETVPYGINPSTRDHQIGNTFQAPPPGMSLPSPHTSSRKKNWTQHSTSQAQGKPGMPDFPDHMMPGRCVLPPLSPKPRVPIQMETVATLDTFHNLTIHINGASKNIPHEADVQVTLVEGYVPLEKLVKKGQWEHGRERSATRTRQSRLSKFKQRISLTSLSEESRRLTAGTLATRQPRTMEY